MSLRPEVYRVLLRSGAIEVIGSRYVASIHYPEGFGWVFYGFRRDTGEKLEINVDIPSEIKPMEIFTFSIQDEEYLSDIPFYSNSIWLSERERDWKYREFVENTKTSDLVRVEDRKAEYERSVRDYLSLDLVEDPEKWWMFYITKSKITLPNPVTLVRRNTTYDDYNCGFSDGTCISLIGVYKVSDSFIRHGKDGYYYKDLDSALASFSELMEKEKKEIDLEIERINTILENNAIYTDLKRTRKSRNSM